MVNLEQLSCMIDKGFLAFLAFLGWKDHKQTIKFSFANYDPMLQISRDQAWKAKSVSSSVSATKMEKTWKIQSSNKLKDLVIEKLL